MGCSSTCCRGAVGYEQLLEGEAADLLWSDPPYGVAYVTRAGEIENDSREQLRELLQQSYELAVQHCRNGPVHKGSIHSRVSRLANSRL